MKCNTAVLAIAVTRTGDITYPSNDTVVPEVIAFFVAFSVSVAAVISFCGGGTCEAPEDNAWKSL